MTFLLLAAIPLPSNRMKVKNVIKVICKDIKWVTVQQFYLFPFSYGTDDLEYILKAVDIK
jgi:hypothetical protein